MAEFQQDPSFRKSENDSTTTLMIVGGIAVIGYLLLTPKKKTAGLNAPKPKKGKAKKAKAKKAKKTKK